MQKSHTLQSRVLVPLLIGLVLTLTPSAASAGVNVTVDGESYLVSGGTFHSEIYPGDREEAAHCIRCFWKVTGICQSWDEAHKSCPYLRLKCPSTMRLAEVRRSDGITRPPTDSPLWQWQGYTCLSDGPPVSEREITQQLSSSWRVLVPTLEAATSPTLATLINFPSRVVGKSATTIPTMRNTVAGTQVTVRAIASAVTSCDAHCIVSPTYVRFVASGPHQLKTTVTWRGYYSVDGFAETEIGSLPIIQRKSLPISVYSLHRKLIPTKKAAS